MSRRLTQAMVDAFDPIAHANTMLDRVLEELDALYAVAKKSDPKLAAALAHSMSGALAGIRCDIALAGDRIK